MPTIAEATQGLTIANTLHIFLAPVGTPWIDLDHFVFGDETTYGGFAWFGDTSAENLPEWEEDGGDITSKRTADRKNIRNIREDKTYTGTINSVALTKDFLEKTDATGKWNEATQSFTTMGDQTAREWAMQIVAVDGEYVSGQGLYKTSILSGFNTYDFEEFQETPVSVALATDEQGRLKETFIPRKRTAAVTQPAAA